MDYSYSTLQNIATMYKSTISTDLTNVDVILKALNTMTNGNCPCISKNAWNENTICPCSNFRHNKTCHCNLFITK